MRVAGDMGENLRGRFWENLIMLIIILVVSLLTVLLSG
jgi:hypothetical protein